MQSTTYYDPTFEPTKNPSDPNRSRRLNEEDSFSESDPGSETASDFESQSPRLRVRRRRRAGAPNRVFLLLLKAGIVLLIALGLLLCWQSVAFSAADADPPPPAASPTPPAPKVETPSEPRPASIEDWMRQGLKKPPKATDEEEQPAPTPPAMAPPASPIQPAGGAALPGSEPKPAMDAPKPPVPSAVVPSAPPSRDLNAAASRTPSMPKNDPALFKVPEPARTVKPLGEIADSEIKWTDSLQLVMALEQQFADHPPLSELQTLRSTFYHHLIDLSVVVGYSDNPRDNLDAVRVFLKDTLGMSAVQREKATLDLLLSRSVLMNRKGSPTGVAVIALVFAEHLSKYLDLEPIVAGDLLGLRYRSGDHCYTLVPLYLDRLYTDQSFAELAYGPTPTSSQSIQTLTRQQFWGLVLGEAGLALLETAAHDRAAALIHRALKLNAEQARTRVGKARILLVSRDFESAREELDAALNLDPNHVPARLERAALLAQMGDPDAQEADLRWLARRGTHPLAELELATQLFRRQHHQDAALVLKNLLAREVATSIRETGAALAQEIAAAPWIARLRDSRNAGDRFAAVDALTQFPLASVEDALVATLDDANLRLGAYAWQALRNLTKFDLPRDTAAWKQALARRRLAETPLRAP
ncbi:MAG: tetratricopeptide repeat protein [Planctomycetota bacterium]